MRGFQGIISGAGCVDLKPSSLAAITGVIFVSHSRDNGAFFQKFISGDGYMDL